MMFSSIRVKLTLWYICVLALIISVFAGVTYSLLVGILRDELNANITETANNVVAAIKNEQNDGEQRRTTDKIIAEALSEFRFRDYQVAIFSKDDKLVRSTSEKELPADLPGSLGPNKFGEASIQGEPYRVYEQAFNIKSTTFKVFLFHTLADQIALESRIQRIFLVVAPLLILLAAIGGYFLAGKSLKPIAAMGDRAKRINAANLHERLPIENAKDELGNLARVFNELLDRLDVEFDRQRRFMADASHELRTPLAIIRGESEVALLKEVRTPEEYQESLSIVNDESERLTRIVEDLFMLARADSGQLKANLQELYLDELVSDCVRSIRTLADNRHITIEIRTDETPIRGDEMLLRRLFLNLLDNAVKYNFDGGTIKINVASNAVTISNTGEAIPVDQRSLIFDRFYRVEKSRTHKGETTMSGAGLGLSISKWIADMHFAKLKYSRNESDENIFTISFPPHQSRSGRE